MVLGQCITAAQALFLSNNILGVPCLLKLMVMLIQLPDIFYGIIENLVGLGYIPPNLDIFEECQCFDLFPYSSLLRFLIAGDR